MRLLFDQNLSFKLCQIVADLFPESSHVRAHGLSEVADLLRRHAETIQSFEGDDGTVCLEIY
ncbi:DUF5615 family PIN-like protein [Bradyrhizobium cajani]|uniref:DUF5615 family PIN-like protein n=1 Tax=Bradyrhizobium cajani TaxID=1928661 RepID=UPI00142EF870|nr:DUF5615 family PIN-like protein [Bradyrhizobium cajani]MCP3373196.1 DUF5615 family PIN-like protein [Bradyrhizobium cajani]